MLFFIVLCSIFIELIKLTLQKKHYGIFSLFNHGDNGNCWKR